MLYIYKLPDYITKATQCETMTDHYYLSINLAEYGASGHQGVESLRLGVIDYTPHADAFKMHHHTKRTDYVTSTRMGHLSWLVSPAFASFLLDFNLPKYQVFDAWVEHHAKRYPYKIFYFCFENLETINFQASSFYIVERGISRITYEKITIESVEHYESVAKTLEFEKTIRAKELFFKESIEIDIIKLIFPYFGLFISERLKDAIVAKGFTGIDFAPVPVPLKTHLVWASTGLPVED